MRKKSMGKNIGRMILKEMGKGSGTPIETDSQTARQTDRITVQA